MISFKPLDCFLPTQSGNYLTDQTEDFMKPGHLHIGLFQPEIPQNAGNIGRLAAATQCRLHMVKPLGFSTEEKNLRRPGLDYWPFLDLEIHDHLDDLLTQFAPPRIAFFSKKADRLYTEMPESTDLLIFGRETSGLPEELHDQYPECFYKIPMWHSGVRSLNLANSVSIVLYHQLARRKGYI